MDDEHATLITNAARTSYSACLVKFTGFPNKRHTLIRVRSPLHPFGLIRSFPPVTICIPGDSKDFSPSNSENYTINPPQWLFSNLKTQIPHRAANPMRNHYVSVRGHNQHVRSPIQGFSGARESASPPRSTKINIPAASATETAKLSLPVSPRQWHAIDMPYSILYNTDNN